MLRSIFSSYFVVLVLAVSAQHTTQFNWQSTFNHELKGPIKRWAAIQNKQLVHEKIFNNQGELLHDSQPKPKSGTSSFKLHYIQDLVHFLEQCYAPNEQELKPNCNFNALGQITNYSATSKSLGPFTEPAVNSEFRNCQFTENGNLLSAYYLKVEPKMYQSSTIIDSSTFTTYLDSTEYALQVIYHNNGKVRAYLYFEPDLYQTVKLEFWYSATNQLVRIENYDFYSVSCGPNYSFRAIRNSTNYSSEQFNCMNFWGDHPSLAMDFIYNEYGQLIRKNQVDKYGQVYFHAEYQFSENGFLESEQQYLTQYNAKVREFSFDTVGNVIEQIEYNRFSKQKTVTTFQIEYFESEQ